MYIIKPEILYNVDTWLTTYLYPQSRYSCPRPPIMYAFMITLIWFSILLLGFTSKLLLSCFPNKTAYALPFIPMCASHMLGPSLSPRLFMLIRFGENKLLRFTLCNLSSLLLLTLRYLPQHPIHEHQLMFRPLMCKVNFHVRVEQDAKLY